MAKEEEKLPDIVIYGATDEEANLIRAALGNEATRLADKHVANPNMGWGRHGHMAEQMRYRIKQG